MEITFGIRDGQDANFLKWLEISQSVESPQGRIHNQESRFQEILETLVGLKREQINRKHRWDEEGETDNFSRKPEILEAEIGVLENEIKWTWYALEKILPLTKKKRQHCRLRVLE